MEQYYSLTLQMQLTQASHLFWFWFSENRINDLWGISPSQHTENTLLDSPNLVADAWLAEKDSKN